MRKLLAGILAASCVASLGITAFAAQDDTNTVSKIIFQDYDTDYIFKDNGSVATDGDIVIPNTKYYLPLIGFVASPANADAIDGVTGNLVGNIDATELFNLLSDPDDFKFKVKKNEGSKIIESVKISEKRINLGGGGFRGPYIEINVKEDMTDAETKIDLDFTFSLKQKNDVDIGDKTAPAKEVWIDENAKITGSVKFFTKNVKIDGVDDIEELAGKGGVVVKPVKNEENLYTWTDENDDLAEVVFDGDSDVNIYFPKLSTKWTNETYAMMFEDQDAFIFDFVGNPKLSSTSRATLTIYNPYIDENDDLTVSEDDIVIYQVNNDATLAASTEVELAKAILDGRLTDVTANFQIGENEDGDSVFTTRLRALGTYIVAEKAPSEEAFDEAEGQTPADDPLINEKPVPSTGKF